MAVRVPTLTVPRAAGCIVGTAVEPLVAVLTLMAQALVVIVVARALAATSDSMFDHQGLLF